MFTIEEKIKIIEQSNSFLELNKDVLPKAHKEDYYFISYSHKDYKLVMKDILLLEERGVNVWYDCDMHIGENWEDIAESYISKFQCKGIIFYLSENSILSSACNKEVDYVLENGKQFFSINIPLPGEKCSSSGLEMLLKLKDMGHEFSPNLAQSFEKAFSEKMLYLSYGDPIERKKEQIEKLVGEDLFTFEHEFNIGSRYNSNCAKLTECKDNSLVKVDLKNRYMINAKTDKEFGNTFALTHIDKCVFANSFKLKTVNLPVALYQIDDYAFANCYKLTDINLDLEELTYIRDYSFSNCKSLAVRKINCNFIGRNAFTKCVSLKNLRLNSYEVGAFAFSGCTGIESVNFENQPIHFHSFAFYGCAMLKEINTCGQEGNVIASKKSVLKIDNAVFEDCASLSEITFSGKIDLSSASDLFSGCKNLTKVNFDVAPKLKTLPRATFFFCRELEQVSGLENVKVFENKCFYECNSLQNINLKNAVEIGEQAFASTSLKEVYLPNVKKIGVQAFGAINTLTKIVIGDKLKMLESQAFYGLDNLVELEIASPNFKFFSDTLSFANPEIVTLSNHSFLNSILQNANENLKIVYFVKGGLTVEQLNSGNIFVFAQEKSDKEGFDKFVLIAKNEYGEYVDNVIIINFENGAQDFVYCQEAGYDSERKEYYLVTGDGKKYYQSEISSISKTYRL